MIMKHITSDLMVERNPNAEVCRFPDRQEAHHVGPSPAHGPDPDPAARVFAGPFPNAQPVMEAQSVSASCGQLRLAWDEQM